jgi:hypothetical protein
MRIEHPWSFCQGGFVTASLQPLPVPDQTVSFHPRALESRDSVVPPTASTPWHAAGTQPETEG